MTRQQKLKSEASQLDAYHHARYARQCFDAGDFKLAAFWQAYAAIHARRARYLMGLEAAE